MQSIFFILKPDGSWTCCRQYDDRNTCSDGSNGTNVAMLASFVSSVLAVNIFPQNNSTLQEEQTIQGAALLESKSKPPTMSLRCGGTLITVLPVPQSRHTLVLQTNPAVTGLNVPVRRLRIIQNVLTLLFGPPSKWVGDGEPRLVTNGIENMIDNILLTSNPTFLLGGVRRVHLASTTVDQLNQTLKVMPKMKVNNDQTVENDIKVDDKGSGEKINTSESENKKEVGGRGGEVKTEGEKVERNSKREPSTGGRFSTSSGKVASSRKPYRVALITHNCNSVLHSRINIKHLSRLMLLLQLRGDLESFETTSTPIYHESTSKKRKEQWYHLVVHRVQCGVLVCEFPMSNSTPTNYIDYMITIQRELFMTCNNLLPAEEPPVPLHLFVDHETVAFVAYDRLNCTSVCPKMRPSGPSGETDRLWKLFWIFLSTSLDTWEENPNLRKISLVEGDIAFHAIRYEEIGNESVDIFLMTTSNKNDENTERMARDIVTKIT